MTSRPCHVPVAFTFRNLSRTHPARVTLKLAENPESEPSRYARRPHAACLFADLSAQRPPPPSIRRPPSVPQDPRTLGNIYRTRKTMGDPTRSLCARFVDSRDRGRRASSTCTRASKCRGQNARMAVKADAVPAAPAGGRAAVRRGRRCWSARVERVYRYYSVLYIFQDTRDGTTGCGLQRSVSTRTSSHEQVRAPHRVSKGTDDQGRWCRGRISPSWAPCPSWPSPRPRSASA